MQGTLQSINEDNTISIKTHTSADLETIGFDYLVICTGSQYRDPIKDANILNLEERRSKMALE